MNVMDNLQEDIGLLQDNLQLMQEVWDLKEPDLKKGSKIKYPFRVCKKFIRKVICWFLHPYYVSQIAFNGATLRAVEDIYRIQNNLMLIKSMELNNEKDILPASMKPRIIQIVSSLNFGDAVGNDVIAIKYALKEADIVTEIYATSIHEKIPAGTAKHIRRLPVLMADDIIIYHFAAEDPLTEMIKELKCKKVLRYHNVTPPEFFKKYDTNAEKHTKIGLRQIQELKDAVDYVMTVSEFNVQDLKNMGYKCPMFVVPILIRFKDYEQEPSEKVIIKYLDGVKNIIFVGRIAPNKKIEDVISAFDYYYKNVNSNSRLIIVGSYSEKNKYYEFLHKHIKRISAKNVIFTGHIAFNEILGYYKVADAFLCMSEHEGFCVPLIEAMYFKVPIVAYSSTAIPETLNGCGVLLTQKNLKDSAKALSRVLEEGKEGDIVHGEENRLKDFNNEVISKKMMEVIGKIAED